MQGTPKEASRRMTMTFAPEPFRSACLEVMYYAVLEGRYLAWGNARLFNRLSSRRQEEIADRMDAIHNIPHLMRDWERCDQQWLRETLRSYYAKWPSAGWARLERIY